MRDCPSILARGIEDKQVPHSALDGGGPKRNHFYVLQAKANLDENAGKLQFCLFGCNGFLLSGGVG